MRKKTIFILAAVFIVLLGVVVYPEAVKRFFPNKNLFLKPDYLLFDTESLNRITFQSSANELVLEKKDDLWKVDNLPVDEERISSLLEALKNLKAGPMVSKNKDNFSSYEVDE